MAAKPELSDMPAHVQHEVGRLNLAVSGEGALKALGGGMKLSFAQFGATDQALGHTVGGSVGKSGVLEV